jgi:microcystin-dependent protein
MANWNLPALETPFVEAVQIYKDRDVDNARMFDGSGISNVPENAIRFNVGSGVFQRREGGSWVTKPLTSSSLATTGVSAGNYGSNILIPSLTINAQGQVTVAGTNSVRTASTTQTGVVQLNDAVDSTSTTQAATANTVKTLNDSKVPNTRTLTAGDGLTGLGDLSADRTVIMGTPSTITGTTSNEVTSESHTHQIQTSDAIDLDDSETLATSKAVKDSVDFAASVGMFQYFLLDEAPDGWLVLDGIPKSRTEYPRLFAVWGEKYGEGDGSTTFGIPNALRRYIKGDDDQVGSLQSQRTSREAIAQVDEDNNRVNTTASPFFTTTFPGGTLLRLQSLSVTRATIPLSPNASGVWSIGGIETNSNENNELRPLTIVMLPCVKY